MSALPRPVERMPAAAVAGDATALPRSGARDPSLCYRCASPNPAAGPWRAVMHGASREFCCAECLAVAPTIDAAGLESFYVQRTVAADQVRPERGREVDTSSALT